MVISAPSRLVKLAALSMLSLGLVLTLAVPVLFDAAYYLGLITVLLASISVFCGIRLWVSGSLESRVLAILVAVAAMLGHGLNTIIGLPGASALKTESGAVFWLALAFELSTVLLIAVDFSKTTEGLTLSGPRIADCEQSRAGRRGR